MENLWRRTELNVFVLNCACDIERKNDNQTIFFSPAVYVPRLIISNDAINEMGEKEKSGVKRPVIPANFPHIHFDYCLFVVKIVAVSMTVAGRIFAFNSFARVEFSRRNTSQQNVPVKKQLIKRMKQIDWTIIRTGYSLRTLDLRNEIVLWYLAQKNTKPAVLLQNFRGNVSNMQSETFWAA